jgi:hypothetical protein
MGMYTRMLTKSYDTIETIIYDKLKNKKSYLDISDEEIFDLNNQILNVFIDNNLINNKRIILIIMECILCFLDITSFKSFPDIFSKFDYVLKFAIDIKPSYTKYHVCKCIELWINCRNINYDNLDDIVVTYMFLLNNNYIDVPSLKKWLHKNNYAKYNYNCMGGITLNNFVLFRTQFFKIIDIVNSYRNKLIQNEPVKMFLQLKYTDKLPQLQYFANEDSIKFSAVSEHSDMSYDSDELYKDTFTKNEYSTSSSIVFE